MAFSYRELFCGSKTFCCCLPVRMGVIAMSFLGILIAGILAIILWFEVASTDDLTSGEKAAFVIAGLVETVLFAASVLGQVFVGAVVRKQSFVQLYAYILYVHFVLNVAVSAYLLYVVNRFSTNATAKACQDTIKNEQAKQQCNNLLGVAKGVYLAIAVVVLLVEMYGTLIVMRYVNQVKAEKKSARISRLETRDAFKLLPTRNRSTQRYSAVPLQEYSVQEEFDPYAETSESSRRQERSSAYDGLPSLATTEKGYGGGSWTWEDVAAEEKERIRRHSTTSEDSQQAQSDSIRNFDKSRDVGQATRIEEVADGPPSYTVTDSMKGR